MPNFHSTHQPGRRTSTGKANKSTQRGFKSRVPDPSRFIEAPDTLRVQDVLAAQQEVGNQVVQRALNGNVHQKQLTDAHGNLSSEFKDAIQKQRGGGASLPVSIQREASQSLGHDFNDVRIHTDEEAHRLSRSLHARAFTIGKDIFFKRGVFAPGTRSGRETLIHELAHVVQQSRGRSSTNGTLKLGAPDTSHEKEAEKLGRKYAAALNPAGTGAVQRQADPGNMVDWDMEDGQAPGRASRRTKRLNPPV